MGKRFAKKTKRPGKAGVLSMLAAAGGALWFWRKKKSSGGQTA